jgi:hypothetical protein
MVGMPISQPILVRLLPTLPAIDRRRVARKLGCPVADLASALADVEGVEERTLALAPEQAALLISVLGDEPVAAAVEQYEPLLLSGLAFPSPLKNDKSWVVPFEVRTALLQLMPWQAATLAVCLWENDDCDLDEFAALHDLEAPTESDALVGTIRLASLLADEDHLARLLESLTPTARNLLTWACEWGAPFDEDALRDAASRLNLRFQDGNAADRVLIRLGLIQPVIDASHQTRFIVPVDVRAGIVPLLDGQLCDRAFEAWDTLRTRALPAFADLVPRGLGGDPLLACRVAATRALAGQNASHLSAFQLLERLHLMADGTPSHHLAALLDSSTPEAFARRTLRAWLSLVGDQSTLTLLAPLHPKCRELIDHLSDEPDSVGPAFATWSEVLFTFRAQLLIGLSVLPPGFWHDTELLGRWAVAAWRRLIWITGRGWAWSTDVPDELRPAMSIDIRPELAPAMAQQLTTLFRELLEPLGAVVTDSTGELFMVNVEALRAIADQDVNSSNALATSDRLIGDDMGLWLPMPIDPGVRVRDVAPLSLVAPFTIGAPIDVHYHDLRRLAALCHLECVGDQWLATFQPSTCRQRLPQPDHRLEWVQWLTARLGQPVPVEWCNALLGLDASSTEVDDHGQHLRRVRKLWLAVERAQGMPPGQLLEEIRGWGAIARHFLRDRMESWVDSRKWPSDPMSLASLLLGELGDDDATATLLRSLAYTDDMFVESACSVALSRVGQPAIDGLLALFHNEAAEMEKRFLAATTLTAVAVLHPALHHRIIPELIGYVEQADLDPAALTPLAVTLGETGHPEVEALFHRLRERGLWTDGYMPFDEALWVVNHSPMFWGAHGWSDPLLDLFAAVPAYESPALT